MKWLVRFFKYIEPIWLGTKDQVSIRRVLAIAFSVDFIRNTSYAVHSVSYDGSDLGGLSSLLVIEAGLIAALLTLTTWQNMGATKDRYVSGNTNNQPPVEQIHD